MNDRYLYRAKRTDNGEWVEGYYTYYHNGMNGTEDTRHVIRDTSTKPGKLYFVDSSTLCQCTGMTDKNGKLIFENDIVTIDEEYWRIEWNEDTARWIIDQEGTIYDFDNYWSSEIEVIGNIFDNKDLLEGSHETGEQGNQDLMMPAM